MNEIKRTVIWDAYTDSDRLQRYYLSLKAKYSRRITLLSLLIAICSSATMIQLFSSNQYASIVSVIFGGVATISGIYLAVSDFPKKLGVASSAAAFWVNLSGKYKTLWNAYELGEDVWGDHLALERQIELIDTIVSQNLDIDDKLEKKADDEMKVALVGEAE